MLLVCWHHHRLLHEGGFTVERRASGEFQFRRPDATVIDGQPTPTRLESCPERLLAQTNAAHGLTIDHTTGRCLWDGEPMDRDMAVEGLLAASGELEWEKTLPR